MKKSECFFLIGSLASMVACILILYSLYLQSEKASPKEDGVWMQKGARETVLRPLLTDLGKQYGNFAKSNGLESFKAFGRRSRAEPYFTNGYYFATSWRQFGNQTLVYYVYASPSKEAIQKGGWMDAIAGERHEIVLEKP